MSFDIEALVQAIREKALQGKEVLIDLPDTLDGITFYVFKGGRTG